MKEIFFNISEIKMGESYRFQGNIRNGFWNGQPFISKEDVTRKVKRITDDKIILECGREFIIDEDLLISQWG